MLAVAVLSIANTYRVIAFVCGVQQPFIKIMRYDKMKVNYTPKYMYDVMSRIEFRLSFVFLIRELLPNSNYRRDMSAR